MREIPILFSTPMVQAILDGRKTMTRRVVKPQPLWVAEPSIPFKTEDADPKGIIKCPYGQPGDLMYVKENTWIWCKKQRNGLTPTGKPKYLYVPVGQHVVYELDHPTKPDWRIDDNPEHDWRMKVAWFMPKWAARIWLECEEIRVERLQEITEDDARAEGIIFEEAMEFSGWRPTYNDPDGSNAWPNYKGAFNFLWDSLNKSRGYSFESNPFVWAISFKVLEGGKLSA